MDSSARKLTEEELLFALANLQQYHSRLDKIVQIRGGLPEEVRDLEDVIEGLRTRLRKLNENIHGFNLEKANRMETIARSRDMIKKYETQLMNVRNSREHEAITKEIELANLDILTSERKIKQFNDSVRENEQKILTVNAQLDEKTSDLEVKNKELEILVQETQKEEEQLLGEIGKASHVIDPRKLFAYNRIRKNMRNGLAVVTMDRGACGGCFAMIPPQRQYEVRQRRKLMICENCGRILVDETYFSEENAEDPLTQFI